MVHGAWRMKARMVHGRMAHEGALNPTLNP